MSQTITPLDEGLCLFSYEYTNTSPDRRVEILVKHADFVHASCNVEPLASHKMELVVMSEDADKLTVEVTSD